jgi:predicted nucleotidyltransferase
VQREEDFDMFAHEKETLKRAVKNIREKFSDRIVSIYTFGSRVRGDYEEWSDFDVLVVVKDKTPEIETEVVSAFVDEDTKSGLSFTLVIKDKESFEMEKRFETPFFENIMKHS